jgi:uncharacterized protein (TIGR02145 family)
MQKIKYFTGVILFSTILLCCCDSKKSNNGIISPKDTTNQVIKNSTSPIINNNKVLDFDGHEYSTVKIGNQIWISENVKAIHFLNGDEIYEAKSMKDWYSFFINKKPCYKKVGSNIIYNGFVAADKRPLLSSDFTIPSQNDFFSLRNFLGESPDMKLASYSWSEMIDLDNEKIIKGNNNSGFKAIKSKYISAHFGDIYQENQLSESDVEDLAWFWTQTKTINKDCLGYTGNCFEAIMIGSWGGMTCDDPGDIPVNYCYGLQIRLIKK